MTKPNATRNHRKALPISAAQRTVIMIICTQFGISKTERAELLQERYGKSSTSDLSSDQAGHFIAEFEKKGFALKSKANPPRPPFAKGGSTRPAVPRSGNVVALASQDERDKIGALADLIEWREANGLQLFLEKRMGIRKGQVRTSAEAYMAIEGLKKMFENGMKAKHGPAWWRFDFAQRPELLPERSRRAVMEYIELHCPEEWR